MTDPLANAAEGPAIDTELVSLTGLGSMFVDYDWSTQDPLTGGTDLPSLACGAAGAGVRWTISKLFGIFLQMHPTLSGRIPVFVGTVMGGGGLLLFTLGDGGGRFWGVDPNGLSQTSSSGTTEHLVYRGLFEGRSKSRYWLMKDPRPLQAGLQVAGAADADDASLAAALAAEGFSSDSAAIAGLRQLVAPLQSS